VNGSSSAAALALLCVRLLTVLGSAALKAMPPRTCCAKAGRNKGIRCS
jgi:hypothetical protein